MENVLENCPGGMSRGMEVWGMFGERNTLPSKAGKSREMITKRSGKVPLRDSIEDIVRVKSMVILGVAISHDLRAVSHVDCVTPSCSRSLYVLSVLVV